MMNRHVRNCARLYLVALSRSINLEERLSRSFAACWHEACLAVWLVCAVASPAPALAPCSHMTPRPHLASALSLCLTLKTKAVMLARRALLAAAAASLVPTRKPAWAAEPSTFVIARGSIALQNGITAAGSDAAGAALYVTAKPADTSTGITAQAGKVPPLAAARYPSPIKFPYDFSLSTADLTPEFSGVDKDTWINTDLLITARFDTDGVAATRGPDDLVGRATQSKRGAGTDPDKWSTPVVELQGRGLTGRLLTGGK